MLPSLIISSVSLPACSHLSCQMHLRNLPVKPCWSDLCTQEAFGVCSMLQHVRNTSILRAKVLQGQKSGRRLDSVGQQPTTCEPADAVLAGSSDMQYMTAVWATGQYITGPSEAGGPCESVTYQQNSGCTCCMHWGGASSRAAKGRAGCGL